MNEILKKINDARIKPTTGRNSMGCSESNYNPYYAIGKCFTDDELKEMNQKGLENLVRLGEYLSEAFY